MPKLITPEVLENANAGLATIPFYPSLPEAQAEIQVDIGQMCGDAEVLNWLVKEAKRRLTKWQGLAGLRSLLEQRCVAADGDVETGEARYFELEAAHTDTMLQKWKSEAKAISGQVQRQIAGVVEMPKAVAVAQTTTTEPDIIVEPAKRTAEKNARLLAKLKIELAKRGGVPSVEIAADGTARWRA